jgi:hypothetical protein
MIEPVSEAAPRLGADEWLPCQFATQLGYDAQGTPARQGLAGSQASRPSRTTEMASLTWFERTVHRGPCR